MAYTFKIHGGNPAQNDGWQESEELVKGSDNKTGIGSIDDSIEGGNAGKIGTSIPTPFARIYLFDTAYTFVSASRAKRELNFYDQLVTQSLDLLQLLFEKGADSKLRLFEWNGEIQTREINSKGFKEGHRTLATALNMAIKSNTSLSKIILIEYDGVLLGGSSPMTLTYTSPNAIRRLQENNIELFTNDKSPLFKERSIKHLRDRSKEFQKYVSWLVRKNIRDFTRDNGPLNTFFNYVKSQNLDITDDELNDIREEYYPVIRRRSELGSIDVSLNVFGNLALRYNDEPIDMKECDFYMRPSVKCFGNSAIPVIIPTDGDSAYDGWKYTKNEYWQSYTTFDYYAIEDVKVEDRYLPTNGAQTKLTTNKYPWLTTGDFFETSLIILGYDLNVSKFYSPAIGNKVKPQFLLPVRKEYFKYFTLEDLRDSLKCEVVTDSRDESRINAVSFELKVKLQNKDYITLRRTYTVGRNGEKPDFPILSFTDGMSFGVFPFYRCPEEDDKKNEYSIYLYGSSANVEFAKLNFYRQDFSEGALERVTDSDTDGEGLGVIRTQTSGTGYSRIYNLRNETSNSFDLIEVIMNDGKKLGRGIAIPMWIQLSTLDENKEAIISIDFGTSNTYVSYLENGTAKPLTIGEEDQQMVLLNDSSLKHGTKRKQYRFRDSFGDAQYMSTYLREFVPSIIGNEALVDNDEYIEYPIKTATIEKQNFNANGKLFSSISVGFNIDNEKDAVETEKFRYVTDLKWSAEEHKGKQELGEYNKDKCRIQAFCDQTLWMIKNKLAVKGFSTNIKMMYFYPDSMSEDGRLIFEECWNESVRSIFTSRGYNVEVNPELEAISPYYSLLILNGNKIYGKSTANIDIGGGTTDYFILDQSRMSIDADQGVESGKAYEASVFFAGNDLWGATYPQSTNPGKYQNNGFVRYMESKIKDCPEQARVLYECFDKSKGMADFSGFFFKNDSLFKFSDLISNNGKFKFVVFLHYASIIYHLTDILKLIKSREPEFKYPEVLTFTGKGSEYIQMISKNSGAIAEMTKELIHAFGITDFKGLEVVRVDNPKALTADGGIYELMSDSSLRINLFDKDQFGGKRSDRITNTPYERIGKECLGLGLEEGTSFKKEDVINLTSKAMQHVKDFADAVYHSKYLEGTRTFLKVNLTEEDYKCFLKFAEESYNVHAMRYLKNNAASSSKLLDESVFFFAIKNTLINLSIYYNSK